MDNAASSRPASPLTPQQTQKVIDAAKNVDGQQTVAGRPLQALSLFLWMALLPLCTCTFFLMCSIPLLWPVIVPYVIWILLIDKAPNSGGRRSKWVSNLVVWRWLSEYFPATLVRVRNAGCAR